MAKIVIDIDERYYALIKYEVEHGNDFKPLVIIANGTPLPKGHGRMIDVNDLEMDADWSDYYDGYTAYSEDMINCAPTIIEADKAESEDK